MHYGGHQELLIYPYYREFIQSLRKVDILVDVFCIKGKGTWTYFKHYFLLRKFLRKNRFDLIHAFYVFSSIIAVSQNKMPVVVSFLGGDINNKLQRLISMLVFTKARKLIFMSKQMMSLAGNPVNGVVLPFGVDLGRFYPINKSIALGTLGWDERDRYILFASKFGYRAKNVQLAFNAVNFLNDKNIKLVEFSNIRNEDLNYYYNACDLLLMTSLSEGSPQVIKEAMACNCPIVSTDVGDVKEIIGNTEGCYITSYDPEDVAHKINQAILFNKRTNGRESIKHLDSNKLAEKMISIYRKMLK